jgi:hypothetical protein
MPTKILKRLNEPARTFHVLLRELLVYSLGWGDIAATPLANFETPSATGTDGQTLASAPNRLTSGAAPFLVGHVGQWLTVYDSEFVNNGVYEIIGVPSASEVVVDGGIYGASFVDDLNVKFRVVDPTLNAAGATEYVVQALAGSASPLWQARIFIANLDNDTIQFEVGPQGGWTGVWSLPALPTRSIDADLPNQTWYALLEDTHIRLFTQTTAGTGVFQIAYLGGAETRRPADDDRFVVSFGGSPAVSAVGSIASVDALDQALATALTYSALTYGDLAQQNMFTTLPDSVFDLRRDSAKIPIGTEAVGDEEDDRGYLRGFRYISDQVAYRSFVDNGRLLLSLGNGLAVDWDGSLSR